MGKTPEIGEDMETLGGMLCKPTVAMLVDPGRLQWMAQKNILRQFVCPGSTTEDLIFEEKIQ